MCHRVSSIDTVAHSYPEVALAVIPVFSCVTGATNNCALQRNLPRLHSTARGVSRVVHRGEHT